MMGGGGLMVLLWTYSKAFLLASVKALMFGVSVVSKL
jgi:hypothetical protein